MPCKIRKHERDEFSDISGITPDTARMQRLINLVSGGRWGNNDKINLIYWEPISDHPKKGHWVAWQDPDPLPEAEVTIAPD